MQRRHHRSGSWLLLAGLVATHLAAARPGAARTTPRTLARGPALPTPEFLAHVSTITDLDLSPDGARVAFTATDSLDPALSQIWLVPTDGGAPALPFAAVGHASHAPHWSPDGTQLIFLAAAGDTAAEQVRLITAAGGESRALTAEPAGVLAAHWSPRGDRLAYLTPAPEAADDPLQAGRPPAGVRLKVLDLGTGGVTILSPDTASVWNMAWSPDGRRLAALASPPGRFGEWRRGYLAFVDADDGRWRRVPGRADPTEGVAFSPEGTRVAYYALPAERYAYGVLTAAGIDGHTLRRLEAPTLRESSGGVFWTRAGITVNASVGVRGVLTRVNPATGARTRLVEKWFGAFSVARDGGVAYTTDAVDAVTELHHLDERAGAAPRRLTRLNPQLTGFPFAPPEVVTWTSFDGRRIEGLFFRPPGVEPGRRLPLVVMPHGGPSAQWSLGFYADPHAPALYLAARGFACLLPNPRGSLGYGEEFNALNRGDPGGADLRDIEAGIDSLVAARVVDGRRLALCGISYGGYLAAFALTKSNRYRCAIVADGPMDLYGNYSQNELAPWWEREFLGASPYENPTFYLERSPLYNVKKIRTPTLILHGAADRRVLPNQSEALYRALKEQRVATELQIYPREGHGVREPAHQVDVMRRTLAWLVRYLDMDPAETRH